MAIVRDVRIGHEQIVAADECCAAAVRRSTAHCDALSKLVPVAGDELGALSGKLQILRDGSNGTKWMEYILAAEARRSLNYGVRHDVAPGAQFNLVADNRVRADGDAFAQTRQW